jgi:hypothetical protein
VGHLHFALANSASGVQQRSAPLFEDSAARQLRLFGGARRDAHTDTGIARIFPGIPAFPFPLRYLEHPGMIQVESLPESADESAFIEGNIGAVDGLK